jgi:hypothetical protein
MSEAHKGQKLWEGKFHSEKSKQKISESKKGSIPWNKGLLAKYDTRIRSGNKHPFWKGGITPNEVRQRTVFKQKIQKQIFKRDNYTCQFCSQVGGYLQVDHIQSWADFPDLRFSVDNCRTLCMACHYKLTHKRLLPEAIKNWGHNMQRRTK